MKLRSVSVLLLVQVAAVASTLRGQPLTSSSSAHLRLPFCLSMLRGGQEESSPPGEMLTNVAAALTTHIPAGGASSSSSYSSELESVKARVWKTASESVRGVSLRWRHRPPSMEPQSYTNHPSLSLAQLFLTTI